MKVSLVTLLLFGALAFELASARSHSHSASNSLAWRQFKQAHGKVYATHEEDTRRFDIFMANKQRIERHNANASNSFTMELNYMSDWTFKEKTRLNGFKVPDIPVDVLSHVELTRIVGDGPVPDQIDWRKKKGRVSSVKDQGHCGSCWAFSTTGLLEGQELPQNMSSFLPLSEQELLDCSFSNHGCDGGLPSHALDDLATIGGIESELDYPYKHVEQACASNQTKFLPLKIKGYTYLPPDDERSLKKAVANYGPVAVALYASQDLVHYKGGVYDDDECAYFLPNHAVLVVGYGKDSKDGEYWIVKNSWGIKWGEQGYFRIRAGENMCSIASLATIATFQ